MPPTAPGPSLREALAAAQAAADAGDAAALSAAVAAAVEACARADASGRIPPPGELAELVALHRRLEQQAIAARDELAAALDRAGRSRRATSAYTGR